MMPKKLSLLLHGAGRAAESIPVTRRIAAIGLASVRSIELDQEQAHHGAENPDLFTDAAPNPVFPRGVSLKPVVYTTEYGKQGPAEPTQMNGVAKPDLQHFAIDRSEGQ